MISKSKFFNTSSRGISLFEIVIAVSLVAVIVVVLASGFAQFVKVNAKNKDATTAIFLAEEALEVMRMIRDRSWSEFSNLSHDTPLWLSKNGSYWVVTPNQEQFINGVFDRRVVISNVLRDGSSDISSSGSNDPNSKLVTVTVYYGGFYGTTTKSLSAIFTKLF